MAALGGVLGLLGALPAETKKVMTDVFTYLVPNLRVGPVDHQTKAENFQAYHLTSTTGTSTGEFDVVHGLGKIPVLAIQTMDLSQVGAKSVVLTISRAADSQRLYLKPDAGSTNAVFSLLVE